MKVKVMALLKVHNGYVESHVHDSINIDTDIDKAKEFDPASQELSHLLFLCLQAGMVVTVEPKFSVE